MGNNVKGASGSGNQRENQIILKILLRGFKRSLISAARPNKSGGSEGEVNKILEISV